VFLDTVEKTPNCNINHVKALSPFVTNVIGLDLSDNMVAEYNKHAQAAGEPREKMFAQQGNLVGTEIDEQFRGTEYFNFDLVTVGLALHHFEDPAFAVKRLAERLRNGGVCLVIDFVEHSLDTGSHGHGTVTTSGFGPENLRRMFDDAGVGGGFDYVVAEKPLVFNIDGKTHERSFFLARGERV
jgi:SAM-dependent methyltransferase